MDCRNWRSLGVALPLTWVLALTACNSGGGASGGGMAIVSCSLGCTASSSVGNQFSCGVTDVFVNQEIRVTFNRPILLASASNNSFQVVELSTGKTPPGVFSLDPTDPNVLVYQPQVTFDSSGNPIFGLTEDETYSIRIPGTALDSLGPFISSTTGQQNVSRLQCTVVASRGIFDANPGRPRATTTVDLHIDTDGDGVLDIVPNQPAANATNVYAQTDVRIVFDDIMNPATLANPVTGISDSIRVLVDPDGDTTDSSDQVPVQGTFTLTIDQNALRTSVVFRPNGGFPSAGTGINKRKIVVILAATIADLGGNSLENAGNVIFTPEVLPFMTLDITESFDTTAQEDSVRSGNSTLPDQSWGGGDLDILPGGGSGRLGDLVIPAGTTVTLNTDSEDFSSPELQNPSIFNIQNVVDVGNPMTFTVDGGIFEFARLRVDAGGTLRAVGSNPARIYVRGEVIVQGVVDVSGEDSLAHDGELDEGGLGAVPGPGGGTGGDGGLRPDGENFTTVGGTDNPLDPGPADPMNPADYALLNGQDGVGIAFPSTTAEMDRVAEGSGGLAWPQPGALPPPDDTIRFPADPADALVYPWPMQFACSISVPGGAGAGGAHSLDGRPAMSGGITDIVPVPPIVPEASAGDSAELMIDDTVKSLDPEQGLLRGGAGGGGAGGHLFLTRVNGQEQTDCFMPAGGGPLMISVFNAQSSSGGGGGGGGLQVQSGRRVVLNGVVNASGGDGGSTIANPNDYIAQPGGAGAGGSVLLQGPLIQIQAVPSRINVRGGIGGTGLALFGSNTLSRGGNGGPGFLRLETFGVAPDTAIESAKVVPTLTELRNIYGQSVMLGDYFTSAVWTPPGVGPSGRSGAQSCWFQPPGQYFQLIFQSDVDSDMDGDIEGDELGWDMSLSLSLDPNPQSYRGPNDIFGMTPLEQVLGNDLGSAPIVVRFQGARALGAVLDPCNLPITGINSRIVPGSLTEWVKHPDELNDFFGDPSLTPNIFRFVIIWDREQDPTAITQAALSLNVRVKPD